MSSKSNNTFALWAVIFLVVLAFTIVSVEIDNKIDALERKTDSHGEYYARSINDAEEKLQKIEEDIESNEKRRDSHEESLNEEIIAVEAQVNKVELGKALDIIKGEGYAVRDWEYRNMYEGNVILHKKDPVGQKNYEFLKVNLKTKEVAVDV